ncbi:MAG: helix-turn-helix transcriptional regulator, partial [Lachnospiraceae bacterium]|nr:helix-turn-helix transcriptional regulator [Lachnospiraceae bacterium]
IGVTPGFLGQIERDETYPSIDNLTKIIRVLDIDANAIFHPQSGEDDSETSILVNEFKIQFTKLSKNNREIVTLLMKKMVELQRKEA